MRLSQNSQRRNLGSTVIKLPPTVMAGQPYRLATTITGPLSGQPSMRRIYIGDMPVSREVTFDTANGTIVYAGDVGRTARIDERSYRTLEEALSDVRAGETVTLISNIAVNEVIATTKADFFLDLAGHDFVLNAPFMVGGVMTVVDSTASAGHIGLGDFLYGGYRLVAGKTCVDTLTTAEGCAFVPMLEEEGDYRYQVKPAQTSEGFVVPVKNTENKTFAEAVLAKTWIEEKTDRNLATAEGRALAVADLNRPRPVTAGTPNNGHTLNECYILGLSTESADSVPFATVGQNDSADTMLFLLGNVSVNAAAGVPVRFALIEVDSQSGVGSVVETKKGEATFSVAVPTVEESLKYYKIGYRIGE